MSKAAEIEANTEEVWWKSFYEEPPFELYLEASHNEDLQGTLSLLREILELDSGKPKHIFDQCCGIGTLSLPFAGEGHKISGVDLSEKFIALAAAKVQEELEKGKALKAHYVAGDAFAYQPKEPVDVAFNWYTSFGYSSDENNKKMLARAYDALKSGGIFALDYPNMPLVLGQFRKHIIKRIAVEGGDLIVLRECQVDLDGGRLLQCWTYIEPCGKRYCFKSSLAIYLPHQVVAMLKEVGFTSVALYGSTKKELLALDSVRLIAVCRK
jgi:SAM-dependent methyltransferase